MCFYAGDKNVIFMIMNVHSFRLLDSSLELELLLGIFVLILVEW